MTTRFFFLSSAFLILLSACNKKENTTNTLPKVTAQTATVADTLQAEETSRKESIYLFTVMPKDSSDVAFVSLSDIYPIDDEKDTLTLPNLEKMADADAQYFTFAKNYRKRFLSKTNISETDSLFVYDYAKNKLASFLVKNLKTAAMLNVYSIGDAGPYRNYDYMIGFEINKKLLNGFSDYYRDALVYVGKENPFSKERLKPISWKKIAKKDYPSKALKNNDRALLKSTIAGNTYFYKTESYQYFLQDYLDSNKTIYGRRLLVVDSKTKDVIIEKLFSQSEGTSPSPLNYENGEDSIEQWTGKLFKNKPEVVFGFEYLSFSCPSISVIDKSNEEINIQCDNRH